MSYQMFYVPRTKSALVTWLSKHMHHVTLSSLKRLPIKQLYAIFYRIRSEE